MSFEEKLRRFVKLYEDMEKKIAQDDLYNKEFTVSSNTEHYGVANATVTRRCSRHVHCSGKMMAFIPQMLVVYL